MLNLTITCGSLVVERTCFTYSLRKITTIKKGTTKRDKENTMIVMILNL